MNKATIKIAALAFYLAVVELLPFALAVILVVITYAWFGAPPDQLWLLPEWWVATVFMLFEGLRDGVRKGNPRHNDLDLIARVTILGSAMLPACAFLVLLIAHSRQPASSPIPPWFDIAQVAFLSYATLAFLLTKGRSKYLELAAASTSQQPLSDSGSLSQ